MQHNLITMKYLITFLFLLALGIGYIKWLDAGCGALGGAMTWTGKVCVANLK